MNRLIFFSLMCILLPFMGFAQITKPKEQQSSGPYGRMGVLPRFIIITDCSGSMSDAVTGGQKVDLMNNALRDLLAKMKNDGSMGDMEIYLIEFDNNANVTINGTLVKDLSNFHTLSPRGTTNMEAAFRQASNLINGADDVVFLFTDGIADNHSAAVSAANDLRQKTQNFLAFGVEGSDFAKLDEIAPSGAAAQLNASGMSKLFTDAVATLSSYRSNLRLYINGNLLNHPGRFRVPNNSGWRKR